MEPPATLWSALSHDSTGWLRDWNWKSALTSAAMRATLFFGVNLTVSVAAATAAMTTEFALRILTAGFYGTATDRLSKLRPTWRANLYACLLVPVVSYAADVGVHWWRGTAALWTSMAAAGALSVVSTLVNMRLMRDDILTVNARSQSLGADVVAIGRLLRRTLSLRP